MSRKLRWRLWAPRRTVRRRTASSGQSRFHAQASSSGPRQDGGGCRRRLFQQLAGKHEGEPRFARRRAWAGGTMVVLVGEGLEQVAALRPLTGRKRK